MSPLRSILVLLLALPMASCASYFKRKTCESTNWREHGKQVAMRGQRLDGDPFIRECQKVEAEFSYQDADLGFKEGMAKYCSYENIFSLGKTGQVLKTDMCDGLSAKKIAAKYQEGLRLYCQKDNGYSVGSSGQVYASVCPKEMEPAFLGEYRRGRRVHLNHVINEKEQQLDEIEKDISRYQRDQEMKVLSLNTLRGAPVIQKEKRYDSATNTYTEEVRVKESEETERRRESLEREIRDLRNKIERAENQRSQVRGEIRQLRSEMISLEPQTI